MATAKKSTTKKTTGGKATRKTANPFAKQSSGKGTSKKAC